MYAVDRRGARAIARLVIGLTVTMDIFVGGGVTGAAMNPARWFGPAVVQGDHDDAGLYWIAPTIGAMIASVIWNQLYVHGVSPPHTGAADVGYPAQ